MKWTSVVYDPARKEKILHAGFWGFLRDIFRPQYREIGTGKFYATTADGEMLESADSTKWTTRTP